MKPMVLLKATLDWMKYNNYTFLILMVYEGHRNCQCQFPLSLHLSLYVVEVKVRSQLYAAGLPLRRPCARPTEHLYNSISEEARSSLENGLSSLLDDNFFKLFQRLNVDWFK